MAKAIKPCGPRAGRLAEHVVRQIETDVEAAGWEAGVVLGSEAELIERYGVSRGIFREAVRIAQHQQIATMRRGPGGGLVVTHPDPEIVQNAARVYLRRAEVTRQQLFEARSALELATVTSAVERLEESGIAQLREAVESEGALIDSGVTLGHARQFHIAVARLAGNPAITLFVEVLALMDEEMVHRGEYADETARENALASHRAHVTIAEAINSGDASLAQYRMRRHLTAIALLLENKTGSDADHSDSGMATPAQTS